ncbi:hypothetical protein [Rhodococcus ruber]|uniref:hypothetical protein n=1 Tax=Rhodococcus ruber TaxID=1830 RepID=UPI001F46D690|nr:hypothetical protein [Rhodococcus ruber]MCF8786909.1 hypothetical protein [Rhodococcus ruber]
MPGAVSGLAGAGLAGAGVVGSALGGAGVSVTGGTGSRVVVGTDEADGASVISVVSGVDCSGAGASAEDVVMPALGGGVEVMIGAVGVAVGWASTVELPWVINNVVAAASTQRLTHRRWDVPRARRRSDSIRDLPSFAGTRTSGGAIAA